MLLFATRDTRLDFNNDVKFCSLKNSANFISILTEVIDSVLIDWLVCMLKI